MVPSLLSVLGWRHELSICTENRLVDWTGAIGARNHNVSYLHVVW